MQGLKRAFMRVFVIPTWHPTPERPTWCNWIIPHIDLLRESGTEAYVLQLGLDGEREWRWDRPVRKLSEYHLYVPVPDVKAGYQRTSLFYGSFLRKYVDRMRELYRAGEEAWGRPDVIHAHVSIPGGYVAARIGSEMGIPVIVQEHYSGFESDARFPWRVGGFVKEMAKNIDGIYAVSLGFAERIKRTGIVPVCKVLPNPVNTDYFKIRDKGSSKQFRIMTTGRLSQIKGTDIFLEALKRLPDSMNWTATIYGDIDDRFRYSRTLECGRLQDRVALRGRVSQKELLEGYCQSNLFVVSSRSETANVSMLEALSCGLPVITTACGGPETLVDKSVAIIIKSEEAGALANGICEVAANTRSYDRKELRQYVVKHYSKSVIAAQVHEAYKNAMIRKAGTAVQDVLPVN
jgi:L-malate glycosyltransferase